MTKLHPKTLSRRAALQLLYSAEITDQSISDLLAQNDALVFEDEEREASRPDAYAITLIEGVEAHKDEIDRMVDSSSDNWAIRRMPIMDRSVLRIAVYEMMFEDDLPLSVSIDEAVELAKRYGGEDESHRFVNGVLGQIAKRLEASETKESVFDADAEIGFEAHEDAATDVAADESTEPVDQPEA